MNRRTLKPYGVAALLIALYLLDIFWLADMLAPYLGIYSSLITEILLVVISVGVFVIFHGKMKMIFPFKRPEFSKVMGTLVLWLGAYLASMTVTIIIAYFFPAEVMGASQGVQGMIDSLPTILGIFVVALSPAICEEMAFRGALLSCFRTMKSRWAAILIVSAIFGAFHGSIWRMIPTMMLGIAMGYLLFETENMFYNMLFHFINNAVPVLMMAVLGSLTQDAGQDVMGAAASIQMMGIPPATVGIYLIYGGAAPFLIYIGNYLLHRGLPGYDKGLLSKEKTKTFIILLAIAGFMLFLGMCVVLASVLFEIMKTM